MCVSKYNSLVGLTLYTGYVQELMEVRERRWGLRKTVRMLLPGGEESTYSRGVALELQHQPDGMCSYLGDSPPGGVCEDVSREV